MKILYYSCLLAYTFIFIACSAEKKETKMTTPPLSDQSFGFEIYDSLVVAYLGNLMLMDISSNGSHFLFIDGASDSILVTDKAGKILYQYKKSGEGPENYGKGRSGNAIFINNEEFLVPTTSQVVQFNITGNLTRSFKPGFKGIASLLVPFGHSLYKQGDYLYVKLTGRYSDFGQQGIEYQTKSRQLERVNIKTGEFEPIIPLPKSSKYNSKEIEFGALDYQSVFTVADDSLYIMFRNEPKIFGYSLTNLDSPVYSKPVPLPFFVERDVSKKLDNGGFNKRDYLLGILNSIYKIDESEFLISYNSGLTDKQFEEVNSVAGDDFNKLFAEAAKFWVMETVVFNGSSISKGIKEPELLGNIAKVISREEIWFNLDYSKFENDYSVIYKTRLVEQ